MESYSLTLDEACQFLKISRPTATNWIRTGRLQATRKDPTKPKSLTSQHGKPALRRFSLRCILSR
ncbi:TPA: helix-turn-helix domain-containing protein [Escherichia coli]|uniref:helix-turn-helix domain-containing protein n=1 Tax=Escherichia coli TaxID=562 RepID=UPI001FCF171D|nr:helix-turn-helix domain-containing protein [Escherichia coli]MCV2996915.1 helix-turn-helix domain-containing protein [Escherichia coli]MCV3098837.1 helix-turn-helix domain-containing protein [Escherichia coli]